MQARVEVTCHKKITSRACLCHNWGCKLQAFHKKTGKQDYKLYLYYTAGNSGQNGSFVLSAGQNNCTEFISDWLSNILCLVKLLPFLKKQFGFILSLTSWYPLMMECLLTYPSFLLFYSDKSPINLEFLNSKIRPDICNNSITVRISLQFCIYF